MNYVSLLRKQAKEKGAAPYMILWDRQITYQQAYEDVCDFITAEWKKAFSEHKKSNVLIVTQDLYHQLLAFLAVMAAEQIPVIGHFDLPEAAEKELAERNGIGFVLSETEKGWLLKKTGPAKTVRYPDACMGVLSSGSSDVPKVMYRTYESWAGFFPEQNRKFRIDGDSVVFTEGSFGFTGNLNIWASVLYAGCSLAVCETFNCRRWLAMIRTNRVSVLYLVPAKLKALTRYLKQEYPSVRMVLAGSQLLGPQTAEKLKRYFPAGEIILYYGASELSYITWLGYDEILRFPGSVGKPVPGVKVWTGDGLIYVDTPYRVEGLGQPCTLRDMGYFNEEGYLIFNGREADIINRGGFKISCTKMENALCSVPGVAQAVVLPYDDKGRGQEAAAFVVCGEDISGPELRQRLKQVLMKQEMPKKILLLEEIPLNSRGKEDREALKRLIRQRR